MNSFIHISAQKAITDSNPTDVGDKMSSQPSDDKLPGVEDTISGQVDVKINQEGTTTAEPRSSSTANPAQEPEPEQSSCNWRVPPKKRGDVENITESKQKGVFLFFLFGLLFFFFFSFFFLLFRRH